MDDVKVLCEEVYRAKKKKKKIFIRVITDPESLQSVGYTCMGRVVEWRKIATLNQKFRVRILSWGENFIEKKRSILSLYIDPQ
jgi:hypothetical protein